MQLATDAASNSGASACLEASPRPTRTIRACMYTPESQQGHARYTRELLSALAVAGAERGLDVSLVTSRDLAPPYRTDLYPIHAILPPMVHRTAFRSRLGWARSRIAHYVGRERIFHDWVKNQPGLDLIHFQEYTPWLAPIHMPRLRRQGLELVSTVHNIANHAHASRSYMQISRRCWRRAWRSCSALLVHTDGLRRALADALGPDRPPIHVTPHAVWDERAEPIVPIRPTPGEPLRLLFFGMIRPNKGLHVLLRALRDLPNCRLVVAGSPDGDAYYEEIAGLIAQLPAGQVEVVPRFLDESEIAGHFDRSHVVVLPYTAFASQSGVLHQALAHGRPVVASDVGGLGESVREWGIGSTVPPNDAAALAEGVRRLSDPDRHARAADAVARVRDGLTWPRMAEATLDVYRSVVR